MIIVTGAAGFIGSCVVSRLNKEGITDIIAVDVLRENDKWKNLRHLDFVDYLDREQLFDFLEGAANIEAIIHMGACSATTERNAHYLMENNYRYTLKLAQFAMNHGARFIYASSGATYGLGELGYDDDEDNIHRLRPLNMYGYSKQLFDLKARREGWFKNIVGLKFFNVYGPNEYFKGDMASVVFKAFNQIRQTGSVRLFKSHRPDFKDGEQLRDFVYVKDVLEVILFFLQNPDKNGLFNVGSGKARSFLDLVNATFAAMGKKPEIIFFDMPEHLRDRYQYFTEARIEKLRKAGYQKEFASLERGIEDYVRNYLLKDYAHY
ncbi:ADP-L-glycero-D-manno-heptose-6-epimerase [Caldithrix abyssi DSM 13497]|uniref:ADP-L-glycero-D-manno-heptose-6-epimerase n=1 Tax=Caldithrix abyssi DSM 13497 TaxID=880073 RepID=H1XQY0_CALAY|nr:ADP-glyceromanno-heptose 6-epimerase [Caldithrix abyssi]APF19986.1 ADP-glyceromanno-heptose 6-epimerase precursor [Caldithrix abyssi DSM 13497]EHO40074.1 ADP-L-glycero-D-manno-heptose-6-epimerase [Caldithrix abyssi DSM 13497]